MNWIKRHTDLAAWIITAAVLVLGFGGPIVYARISNPPSGGLTSPVGVADGGTGATSLTDHGVLVGSGTGAITALTVGTNGQLLVGSTGADPVFATLNCATGVTCTTGAGTLQIDVDDAYLLNTGDTATGNYTFDTNTFFIDASGDVVGVGTTTPWGNSVKLNVYGGSIVNDELATSSLSTVVIDWTQGNQQTITMSQATAVQFSNVINGSVLRLILCSDATGRAVSWSVSNLLWQGGTEPTETAASNKCDLFTFVATKATSTPKIFGASVLNF